MLLNRLIFHIVGGDSELRLSMTWMEALNDVLEYLLIEAGPARAIPERQHQCEDVQVWPRIGI